MCLAISAVDSRPYWPPFPLQKGVAAFLCGVLTAYKCRNIGVLPVPSASSSEAGGESLHLWTGCFLTACLVNHNCDPTIVALIPDCNCIVAAHIPTFVNGRQAATGANGAACRITDRPHQWQRQTRIGIGHGRREGQCRPIIRHRHTHRTDRDDIVRSLRGSASYHRNPRDDHRIVECGDVTFRP